MSSISKKSENPEKPEKKIKKKENAGTRELKKSIKILLENGYEYTGSIPAEFTHPSPKHSISYRKYPVDTYNNWQMSSRNDSEIELIFTEVKTIPREISESLRDLGYEVNQSTEYVNYSGCSLAVFKKKEFGTGIKVTTDVNGKKTRMVDIHELKGETTVFVLYDDDFDHENAKKYHEKANPDYEDRKDPYASAYEDLEPEEKKEALEEGKIKATFLAKTFMDSLTDEIKKEIKEIKEKHGGRTIKTIRSIKKKQTRKTKKRSV